MHLVELYNFVFFFIYNFLNIFIIFSLFPFFLFSFLSFFLLCGRSPATAVAGELTGGSLGHHDAWPRRPCPGDILTKLPALVGWSPTMAGASEWAKGRRKGKRRREKKREEKIVPRNKLPFSTSYFYSKSITSCFCSKSICGNKNFTKHVSIIFSFLGIKEQK